MIGARPGRNGGSRRRNEGCETCRFAREADREGARRGYVAVRIAPGS
jgi:hypothetical protein